MCHKTRAFRSTILEPVADEGKLRELSWNGIPNPHRALTWKILLGYLPVDSSRRAAILNDKRLEYMELAATCYASSGSDDDKKTLRQIRKDIPRTAPEVGVFQHPRVRISLERLLYTWAKQNPDTSYVQGMDDLATPLFIVFLSERFLDGDIDALLANDCMEPTRISFMDTASQKHAMEQVEADCYWCLSRILSRIQDQYTPEQPGLRRMIRRLNGVLVRNDPDLHDHMQNQGIETMHFAFRWINCLLLREINLGSVIRMWDCYLAEGVDAFQDFHVYVCAALLDRFSDKLQEKHEFGDLLYLLQKLPTRLWTHQDVELLLSEAFVLRCVLVDGCEKSKSGVQQVKKPPQWQTEQTHLLRGQFDWLWSPLQRKRLRPL